jgi:nitrite reductase/ring-hydroxylating ferredoxin subunit
MTRHRVADVEELSDDGDRVLVEVEGREIGVFRIDGEYHALLNYCPHQAAPLCQGDLTGQMVVGDDGWEWHYDKEGEIVTCPWHGWKFDVESGVNVKDDRYAVPTYEVEVEDGAVYVTR